MRTLTTIIAASLVLAGCKTAAPPPDKPSFEDDQVIVTDGDKPDTDTDPGPNTDRPEPEPEPDPDPEPEPEPEPAKPPRKKKTESFVAEPTLPDDMSYDEMALSRTVQVKRTPLVFAPAVEGCGIPEAIKASSGDGPGFAVDSCSRVIAAAHARTYKRTMSKLGVIDASVVEIRHDGQILWSTAPICIELRQDEKACKTDFISKLPKTYSFVGPVLSHTVETAQARGGGPASSNITGYVVDVRTGQPAKFAALIDEDSLIDGLKQDSFMRRTLNPVELDKAKTLDEIWKLWRTQDFAFFGAYYFGQWDADNGLAAMRIWYLEDNVGEEPIKLKELEIWVRPKRTWRAAFEDAASGASGFLAP